MAPANQPWLSFAGSEDGEAETVTCRVAKPFVANDESTLRPPVGLTLRNRRMQDPYVLLVWQARVRNHFALCRF